MSAGRPQSRRRAAAEARERIVLQWLQELDAAELQDERAAHETELELATEPVESLGPVELLEKAKTRFLAKAREFMELGDEKEENRRGFRWLQRRRCSETPTRLRRASPKRLKLDDDVPEVWTPRCEDEEDDQDLVCMYCTERPRVPQYCNNCHQLVGCRSCLMRWFCAEDVLSDLDDLSVVVDTVELKSSHRRCPLCNVAWTGGCPDVRPSFHRSLARRRALPPLPVGCRRHRLVPRSAVPGSGADWATDF